MKLRLVSTKTHCLIGFVEIMTFKILIIFPCIFIYAAYTLRLAFLLVLDHCVSFAI